MALTIPQKNWISRPTTTPAAIAAKVNEGAINLNELKELGSKNPILMAKVNDVLSILSTLPDPVEMREYSEIQAAYATAPASNETFRLIAAYLAKWENAASAADHVAVVRSWYDRFNMENSYRSLEAGMQNMRDGLAHGVAPSSELKRSLNDFVTRYSGKDYAANDLHMVQTWQNEVRELEAAERKKRRDTLLAGGVLNDWNEAVRYLRDFPDDHETATTLDNLMWEWVTAQENPDDAARKYMNVWGSAGRHTSDIARINADAVAWNAVKDSDIYTLIDFKTKNPGNIFTKAADIRIQQRKDDVLSQIRAEGVTYPADTFLSLAESGNFTREQMMWAADCEGDDEMYDEILRYKSVEYDLNQLWDGRKDNLGTGLGDDDVTDVIFFGIAGSGKTCALTGLILNDSLSYNSKRFSAPYADCIRAFGDKGFAMRPTSSDFVATIECTIKRGNDHYRFNLFDMAGETFRTKIAQTDSTSKKLTLQDMGKGAPEILAKPNDKLFFMFIDPAVNDKHKQEQRVAIRKFLDLMFEDNPDVMRRVRGLHFIVTKADMLGEYQDRRDLAREYVRGVLNPTDVDKLVSKCREFGINQAAKDAINGHPRVFPFSLGKFFVTNRYRLDDTSSNEILQIIADYSAPEVKKNFGTLVRGFFANPRF